jgi:Haem-binding domain
MRRWLLRGFAIVIVAFLAIQLVPYGRSHTNPPVTAEPTWDSPQTRDLAARACFDCHSNQTDWPWYTNIAPVSWLTQRHVDEGRAKLNFSTWGTGRQETQSIGRQINSGEMPPWDYLLLHPAARLGDAEKAQLISGLQATLGSGG